MRFVMRTNNVFSLQALLMMGTLWMTSSSSMSLQKGGGSTFVPSIPQRSSGSLHGETRVRKGGLTRSSSMRAQLSALPSMDSAEMRDHEIVSVMERVGRKPTWTPRIGPRSLTRSESNCDLAYRLQNSDVIRLKTSLYPEMRFKEHQDDNS